MSSTWSAGPGSPGRPAEEVGLEPFAPPEYLAGTATEGTAGTGRWMTRHPRRGSGRAEGAAVSATRSLVGGLPYLALGIFVVGHIWRWRYDQFGWTSRSTQLQERRLLKWGAPLFHYGTFAAIGGHVLGVLIPAAWTRAVGIPGERLPLVLGRRRDPRRGTGASSAW